MKSEQLKKDFPFSGLLIVPWGIEIVIGICLVILRLPFNCTMRYWNIFRQIRNEASKILLIVPWGIEIGLRNTYARTPWLLIVPWGIEMLVDEAVVEAVPLLIVPWGIEMWMNLFFKKYISLLIVPWGIEMRFPQYVTSYAVTFNCTMRYWNKLVIYSSVHG